MSEAPERIWADDDGYWSEFDPSEIRTVVGEYLRADLVDALIREAVEALEACRRSMIALGDSLPLETLNKIKYETVTAYDEAELKACATLANLQAHLEGVAHA